MNSPNSTLICIISLLLTLVLSLASVPKVSAQMPRGPMVDKVSWRIIRSPAVKLHRMTIGPPKGTDIWTSPTKQPSTSAEMHYASENGGMRFSDVEIMDMQGKTISGRGGFHVAFFGFNCRRVPLNDVNFRHALAHLVPKDYLIDTLFRWVAVKVGTMVPPAQSLYHNPNVDRHPYSRDEAERILTVSGYQKINNVWYMPDGSPIPPLGIYTPDDNIAPTSFAIASRLESECDAIGLKRISVMQLSFSSYIDRVFNGWNFDIFLLGRIFGRFPTQIYTQFNTRNNFLGSANPHGITTPGVIIDDPATPGILENSDYYGNVVWTSLDPSAIETAAKKFQELIMGGSTTDPLSAPAQNTNSDNRTMAIPVIPVYSINAFDAQHPLLRGAVNMFGYGINNMWTWMNIHWSTSGQTRPGTSLIEVWPILGDFPKNLNPLSTTTVYDWTFMDPLFDGLVAVNPTNHRDEDWIAYEWSFGAKPGGMYVKFKVPLTDSESEQIRWQDDTPISMDDIKFAWDFNGPQTVTPRPHGGWEIPLNWAVMRFYEGASISGNEITANFSTTSPWYIYTLAGLALQQPPQVWMHDASGNDWVAQAQILDYQPSNYPYNVGNATTRLFGTGPFILNASLNSILLNSFGDLLANRDYWRPTNEIQAFIADMFHRSGDVDLSGKIDVLDLASIGANMWSPGPIGDVTGPIAPTPGPWPWPKKDGEVNSLDLAMAGKFYGETLTVPYP